MGDFVNFGQQALHHIIPCWYDNIKNNFYTNIHDKTLLVMTLKKETVVTTGGRIDVIHDECPFSFFRNAALIC